MFLYTYLSLDCVERKHRQTLCIICVAKILHCMLYIVDNANITENVFVLLCIVYDLLIQCKKQTLSTIIVYTHINIYVV